MENTTKEIINKYSTGEPFVPVRVVAAHFGMSVSSVYRHAESGKIPSYMFCGKRRFRISELVEHYKSE